MNLSIDVLVFSKIQLLWAGTPSRAYCRYKDIQKKQDLSEVKEKCKLKNLAIHEWIAKHPQTEKQNKTKTFQGKTFSGRKNSNKGIDDNKLHPRNTTPLTTTRLDLTCSRDIESDAQQRR